MDRQPNRCPQLASGNGPISTDEDCLYLNIYRPMNASRSSNLPVLFGSTVAISSMARLTNTTAANWLKTGIIVVEANYRLTVFGFLSLRSLSDESPDKVSGNYGLMDQQAALKWVQRNIREFGGNPGLITIDGESAGGWSVCAHLASPLAKGLFARAIIQSGSCPAIPLPDAEASGAALAAKLGCSDSATVLTCLRAKPAPEVLAASAGFVARPVIGDGLLPRIRSTDWRSGRTTRYL